MESFKLFSIIVILPLSVLASLSFAQTRSPLLDAAKIQQQNADESRKTMDTDTLKEQTLKKFNFALQSLFFQYYVEVKKSGLKLSNAKNEADEMNERRKRNGQCCDILIADKLDGGMYVVTTDGDGIFAIDGYGLQYVKGEIKDSQFDRTGIISSQCKYEVTISYNNSRTYSCSEFQTRKLDNKVVSDMMEMLPIAMKSYIH